MTLKLFHTAEVHVATFEALRDRIAPGVELSHVVRPDWLTRAQAGIGDALREDIARAITDTADPALCTCTTIGPAAAGAGALRIDAPMMAEAAQLASEQNAPLMMAYCLESTLEPSVALLDAALGERDCRTRVHTLDLGRFWPLFEAAQHDPFAAVLATAIRDAAKDVPDLAAIILAQASMAGAAPLLAEMPIPVLSAPETALRALLAKG